MRFFSDPFYSKRSSTTSLYHSFCTVLWVARSARISVEFESLQYQRSECLCLKVVCITLSGEVENPEINIFAFDAPFFLL